MRALLLLFLTGCAAPRVELHTEIPAPVLLRMSGIEPQPADAELPPVKFDYVKLWYDGTVSVNFRRHPDGTMETEVVSAINAEDARIARGADQASLQKAAGDLVALLRLLAGAGVPLLAEPPVSRQPAAKSVP